MVGEQWPMYVWSGAVAVAIVVAVWTATNWREIRPTLPPEHVAAAALLGYFGWQSLLYLPGAVFGYFTLTAGLGNIRGLEGHQAFVVAQIAFVVAAAFAIGGILRRRPWGAVLGVGLGVALALWSVLNLLATTINFGESMGTDAYLSFATGTIGMQAVPAVAAIALLLWPYRRRSAPV